MLTEQEIFKFAMSMRESNSVQFAVGCNYGAKWANDQNAAEIAELVHALREIDEQLGDKQTLALTRILKDIVTNALKKY